MSENKSTDTVTKEESPSLELAPKPTSLWNFEFTLIFLIAMFSNVFIAIFYGFDYWMENRGIGPQWRGILLGVLGLAVLCTRLYMTAWLLRHRGLWLMTLALVVSAGVMMSYDFASTPASIFALRFLQGMCFAIVNSINVSILVDCIPEGQSTRAFAMFSLTYILPYSAVPLIGEYILTFLANPSHLYTVTSVLALPALFSLFLLVRRLPKKEFDPNAKALSLLHVWKNLRSSGLILIFLSVLFFACAHFTFMFFLKGLSIRMGVNAGHVFGVYTVFVILVRFVGNNLLAKIPRMTSIITCAALLVAIFLGFAFGPSWMLIPLAVPYGIGMGIAYPMLMATNYDMSPPENRSLNSNTMLLFFDAATMVCSLAGGAVLDLTDSYGAVLANGAVYMALIVVCMTLFIPRWKQRQKAA